jgi:Mn2+/Fe2+ NRAMP family transporter
LNSAKQAAEALRPVAGSGAVLLFAWGLLGASALAGAVVPLSSSYAISEAIGVERSMSRSFRDAPLFLGLFTFQIAFGAVVALTPVNLISLLIGTQVVQGIVTPIVLIFILVMANRRELLGEVANKPAYRALATIAVGAISIMSLLLLVETVVGWFSRVVRGRFAGATLPGGESWLNGATKRTSRAGTGGESRHDGSTDRVRRHLP